MQLTIVSGGEARNKNGGFYRRTSGVREATKKSEVKNVPEVEINGFGAGSVGESIEWFFGTRFQVSN